jgi:hypothetical protein
VQTVVEQRLVGGSEQLEPAEVVQPVVARCSTLLDDRGGMSMTVKPPPGAGSVGPGWSSTSGQKIGDTTSSGMSACPSRMTSSSPCSAGQNVRSVIDAAFTRLMPTFTEITSAGASRMTRPMNGSSWHWPPKPKSVSSSPSARATIGGQASRGRSTSTQWLIDEP